MDGMERTLYSLICSRDGIKAKEIGRLSGLPKNVINHYLYRSHFLKDLCCLDADHRWCGLIRQAVPHQGLGDFSGYYSMVSEFLDVDYEEFFNLLTHGCRQIGRNLNDTRGLFHSFEETYYTMQDLFGSLLARGCSEAAWKNWEIAFELRIKRSRMVRIYADVLLITGQKVFSLEFKMKPDILPGDVKQAGKYTQYLEVLFGDSYDVIPALILSEGHNLYKETDLLDSTAMLPVCSGDNLWRLVTEYENLERK